jgi:leucyl/phenylalanyl-tRNA---protein transferase
MLFILDPNKPDEQFPPVEQAEFEPDGLLAVGGDLSVPRLLNAYRSGIFPWYNEDQPILWWSPDPRSILYPERLRISRSLRKRIRNCGFSISIDQAFQQVVTACADPRKKQAETWISQEMQLAYLDLFKHKHAHSVEIWDGEDLVGGLYGVAIGMVFFGESMFSRRNDASKIALAFLCKRLISWGYRLIDCQVYSEHITSLGAEEIQRSVFCDLLSTWCNTKSDTTSWSSDSAATKINV